MTKKTIAKFCVFVILAAAAAAFLSGCGDVSSKSPVSAASHYQPPTVVGKIKSADITESSGLAASKCQRDVLWTHNDSGDDAFIFAINTKGDSLGTWKLPSAENLDWEDIAEFRDPSGKCYVYVGEIGDNKAKRHEHAIYRVAEPTVSAETTPSNRESPLATAMPEKLTFVYPDYLQDAETLIVRPQTGDIYVVTKRVSGPAGVYRLRPVFGGEVQTAVKVADLSVPAIPNGFLTGGDASPDGRRVVIGDYTQGYEYTLPDGDPNFDDIWKQEPETIDLGKRKTGESICYSADGTSLFAGSEGVGSPLIEIKRNGR